MSEPFEFLIEVVDRITDGYRLRVAFPDPDSPSGVEENRTVAAFDAADAELRGRLAVLPTSVLASAARARYSTSPLEETARDVGDRLFRAVMVGETLGDFSRLRRRALAAGTDVRISLRIQPPELAALPWEYLFDARTDKREFIGRSCMVTRSAGSFSAVPRLAVDGSLRVLAMVSLPGDQAALDTGREQDGLSRALAPMAAAGRVQLHWVPPTKQALLAAMQAGPWHAFHYVGHGDFDPMAGEGRLAFTGPDGSTDYTSARQLATLLGTHPTLRLAVLNACQTSAGSAVDNQAGVAAALVHAGLPAVVAMQFPITDDAAPVFSQAFYESLAAGRGVDQCVRAGRTAITLANDASLEWGTPVLHLRSTDGVLFGFTNPATPTTTQASAPSALSAADSLMAETMLIELPKSVTTEEDPLLATQLQSALLHLTADLVAANTAMNEDRYDESLVAKLEQILTGFSTFYGEKHENTLRAGSALSKAQRGLALARRRSLVSPSPADVPGNVPDNVPSGSTPRSSPGSEAPLTAEDEEDAPRRKTIRTPKSRPRSALSVTTTPGFTVRVQHTRVRALAAAEVNGSLCLGIGGDNGIATIYSSRNVFTQYSPTPYELKHTESGPDGRDSGPAPVHAIRFDPAGRTVTCLAGSGLPAEHLVVWTMSDVRPHRRPGGLFAYLPGREHSYVASEGFSGLAIRSFEPHAGAPAPLPHVETVLALAVSRDGSRIAAVGQNRTRVWDGDGGFVRFVPSWNRAKHVALSADGGRLVVAESPTSLAVVDTASGDRIGRVTLDADASHVWEVGGAGLLVTTQRDGLLVWDLEDLAQPVHRIAGSFAMTVRPAFTPAGDVLVARNMDGRQVHTFRVDVAPVA